MRIEDSKFGPFIVPAQRVEVGPGNTILVGRKEPYSLFYDQKDHSIAVPDASSISEHKFRRVADGRPQRDRLPR